MKRREWIKKAGAGGIAAVSMGSVLGDSATSFELSVTEFAGSETITPDNRIELLVPEDAANGAVVPVGVSSNVPDTLKIVLLVDKHETSKVAELDTSNPMLAPRLSTHLQLENAAIVTALVQSKSGWFSQSSQVKTLGESCEK